MRKMLILCVMVIFAAGLSAGRIVRINSLPQGSVTALMEEGFDITSVDMVRGYTDVMVPEEMIPELELRFPDIEVMPLEWGELLAENSKNAGYYYSPDENLAFWCTLAADHSDLADTPVNIGQSYLGEDIYMIQLTSPIGDSDYKPPILFNSLIHAREPGGNSVVIDFAMWLTDNYDGGDTRAAWILDNTTLYIVPIANPDGYAYNLPSGGYHRKNMNFTLGDGVDLNRNWGYEWGYDNIGSSPKPSDDTYRGTAPFSEPETQVLRDFILSVNPIALMNYHTYGGYLLFPYSYNNSATPDQTTFQAWGSAMTSYNGYYAGRCGQALGYNANGDQVDWSYSGNGMQGIMAFTPEVGDNGFWGGQNDTTLIEEFCEDCRYMNIWLCMTAPGFTGITGESIEPLLAVGQVTPNPVVGLASFSLSVSGSGCADLAIYDTTGRIIADLPTDELVSGENQILWNVPAGTPSGLYIIRARGADGTTGAGRFTLLR